MRICNAGQKNIHLIKLNSMNTIFSLKKKTAYSGEVVIRYNFKSILKWMIILTAMALICGIAYGIIRGAIWLFEAIMPVFAWVGDHWLGTTLILLALAGLVWAGILGWYRKLFRYGREKMLNRKGSWLWLLAALLLLLCVFFVWKGCGTDKQETPETVFKQAFDDVITTRAYLDGVQNKGGNLALVGLKYVQGLSVREMSFDGKTYDEAVAIVANEWRPLVMDKLVVADKLDKQQLSVVILAAMRMGPSGFQSSAFLAKLNAGKFDEALNALCLQKDGEAPRKVGEEPQKYFYVLRLLWQHQLNIADLLDYPIMSYLDVPLSEMYDADGRHRFSAEIAAKLKKGVNSTPRQALGL